MEDDLLLEQIFVKRLADFDRAMDDDFNTALAIGILFETVGDINGYLRQQAEQGKGVCKETLSKAKEMMNTFNLVLGLFKVDEKGNVLLDTSLEEDTTLVEGLMNLLIEMCIRDR